MLVKVAFRVPFHGFAGFVGANRSSPTGGSAKGMAQNESTIFPKRI